MACDLSGKMIALEIFHKSDTMGQNFLEKNMPNELKVEIMSQSASLGSLGNLLQASRQYYMVFNSCKKSILDQIIRRLINREVVHDALFLVEIFQAPPTGSYHQFTIKKMEDYVQSERTFPSNTKLMDLSTSIELCRIHVAIEYHLEQLSKYALSSMGVCAREMSLDKAACSYAVEADLHRMGHSPLSPTEKVRLRRALYRTELYGKLFNRRPNVQVPMKPLHQSEQEKIFLTKFPPWEVEEMACVWHYFQARLGECFDDLEDEVVQLVQKFGPLSTTNSMKESYDALDDRAKCFVDYHSFKNSATYAHWQMNSFFDPRGSYRFFTNESKLYEHDNHIQGLCSQGLLFLRNFFRENKQQQMRAVLSYAASANLAKPEPTFIKAYNGPYNTNIATRIAQWPQEQDNSIDDVSLALPSAGYRWARVEFAKSASYPCRHKGRLRALGYVFWDKKRLDASHIFQYK